MSEESVLLDACSLLNIYGTGEMESIIRTLPFRVAVGVRARREAQWIRVEGEEEREPVDIQPLVDTRLVVIEELQSQEEIDLFVELGLLLDDGEAEALALAIVRGYSMATDDRKARRMAEVRIDRSRLWSTLELLHEWHTRGGPSGPILSKTLRRMAYCSTYYPRRSDPLWGWWSSVVEDE